MGVCCGVFMLFAMLALGVSYMLTEMSTPNGELPQWYAVEACSSPASSFEIIGRGVFDAYLMRPNDANWQPGSACPSAEPTTSTPPLEVSLEQDDGWRLGAAYAPIMLLPTGSYASMAFEAGARPIGETPANGSVGAGVG